MSLTNGAALERAVLNVARGGKPVKITTREEAVAAILAMTSGCNIAGCEACKRQRRDAERIVDAVLDLTQDKYEHDRPGGDE